MNDKLVKCTKCNFKQKSPVYDKGRSIIISHTCKDGVVMGKQFTGLFQKDQPVVEPVEKLNFKQVVIPKKVLTDSEVLLEQLTIIN